MVVMIALGNIQQFFEDHPGCNGKRRKIISVAHRYVGGTVQLICVNDLRRIMGQDLAGKLLRDMEKSFIHFTIWKYAFIAHLGGVRDELGFKKEL